MYRALETVEDVHRALCAHLERQVVVVAAHLALAHVPLPSCGHGWSDTLRLAGVGPPKRARTLRTAEAAEELHLPDEIHSDPGHSAACPRLTDR
ncbi:hypothetical protein GCM10023321_58940 [Pseudonocardia eucalypti]|uniref:Uncharacterized protein n=1 Tax=Pseudonocardia eucalypti TaxID=648755 RepID=A0ABP9QTN8_9PSEU